MLGKESRGSTDNGIQVWTIWDVRAHKTLVDCLAIPLYCPGQLTLHFTPLLPKPPMFLPQPAHFLSLGKKAIRREFTYFSIWNLLTHLDLHPDALLSSISRCPVGC